MRERVAIARALARKTRIIHVDEPALGALERNALERDPVRSCLDGLMRFSVSSTVLLTIPKSDSAPTAYPYDPRRPYDVDLSLV